MPLSALVKDKLTYSKNPILHPNVPTYVQGSLVNMSFYPSVDKRSQRGQVNPNFRRYFVQCLIFSLLFLFQSILIN